MSRPTSRAVPSDKIASLQAAIAASTPRLAAGVPGSPAAPTSTPPSRSGGDRPPVKPRPVSIVPSFAYLSAYVAESTLVVGSTTAEQSSAAEPAAQSSHAQPFESRKPLPPKQPVGTTTSPSASRAQLPPPPTEADLAALTLQDPRLQMAFLPAQGEVSERPSDRPYSAVYHYGATPSSYLAANLPAAPTQSEFDRELKEHKGAINAFKAENTSILQQLENMQQPPGTVKVFSYDVRVTATGDISVKEVEETINVKKYLAHFQNSDHAPLEDIFDMFNDKFDYTAFYTWRQITAVNEHLCKLSTKLGMVISNEDSLELFRQLHANMRRVNAVLKLIQGNLTAQESRLQEVQAKVAAVTKSFLALKVSVGVRIVNDGPLDTVILRDESRLVDELKKWYPNKKWQLLYRYPSGDQLQLQRMYSSGFLAAGFHAACDHKGPTLTLISTGPSGCIFGGYTSSSWNSRGEYIYCADASIFSLVDFRGRARHQPVQYYVSLPQFAICGRADCGPIFGNGHDIFVYGGSTSMRSSQPLPALGAPVDPQLAHPSYQQYLVKTPSPHPGLESQSYASHPVAYTSGDGGKSLFSYSSYGQITSQMSISNPFTASKFFDLYALEVYSM